MGAPLLQPRPLYQPRNPQTSGLWRVTSTHFDEFERVYDERYAAKYGFWRPIIRQSVQAYLKCGDLREGFARDRCPNCAHEMFVAFSKKSPFYEKYHRAFEQKIAKMVDDGTVLTLLILSQSRWDKALCR